MHKITVPQRKNHRIGVFVDVSNMYHSAKNLYKSRVNFRELLKLATANRQLVRAIAYVIKSDTKEEKAFFDALEKAGYELKSKDLQIFPGGMKKGDWDVAIAIDAITLSKLVDVVVLVSGIITGAVGVDVAVGSVDVEAPTLDGVEVGVPTPPDVGTILPGAWRHRPVRSLLAPRAYP